MNSPTFYLISEQYWGSIELKQYVIKLGAKCSMHVNHNQIEYMIPLFIHLRVAGIILHYIQFSSEWFCQTFNPVGYYLHRTDNTLEHHFGAAE